MASRMNRNPLSTEDAEIPASVASTFEVRPIPNKSSRIVLKMDVKPEGEASTSVSQIFSAWAAGEFQEIGTQVRESDLEIDPPESTNNPVLDRSSSPVKTDPPTNNPVLDRSSSPVSTAIDKPSISQVPSKSKDISMDWADTTQLPLTPSGEADSADPENELARTPSRVRKGQRSYEIPATFTPPGVKGRSDNAAAPTWSQSASKGTKKQSLHSSDNNFRTPANERATPTVKNYSQDNAFVWEDEETGLLNQSSDTMPQREHDMYSRPESLLHLFKHYGVCSIVMLSFGIPKLVIGVMYQYECPAFPLLPVYLMASGLADLFCPVLSFSICCCFFADGFITKDLFLLLLWVASIVIIPVGQLLGGPYVLYTFLTASNYTDSCSNTNLLVEIAMPETTTRHDHRIFNVMAPRSDADNMDGDLWSQTTKPKSGIVVVGNEDQVAGFAGREGQEMELVALGCYHCHQLLMMCAVVTTVLELMMIFLPTLVWFCGLYLQRRRLVSEEKERSIR